MITKNAPVGANPEEEPDVLGYAIPEMDTLSELDLFRDLRPEDLSRLQGLLRRRVFPAGAELMATEQPGDVAYVIVDGAVKVHIESPDGTDVILAILGPGEVVGEMSVVDSLGRSATVVTLEESTLL